ncbi:MAG: hotdog fold thioesterase [Peptococcaceae bacterium]|nr:hotdog fold thioesterase [Peptococcaceae bacterium]
MTIDKAEILRVFAHDYLAQLLGIEIVDVDYGIARVRGIVTKQMLNALGKTHGAALFAIADFALAVASNSYGEPAVSTNVSINYLKSSTLGTVIEATATEENRSRKMGLYRIEICDDKAHKLALAHGEVYLLGK